MTDTRSVTITAQQAATVKTLYVANIAMSLRTFRKDDADALASITVRDQDGKLVPGATVSGSWSGVVNGTGSATTNTSGVAAIRSKRAKAPAGSTFSFTVTGASLAGYSYDPAMNVETSDSITR